MTVSANFFWHGDFLSLYEWACLSSFVRPGIDVRLHSFNLSLQVPAGVQLMDAGRLASLHEVTQYTQGGHQHSIAAFTDIFRYRVLQEQPGWWFDTDVFCLADADRFLSIEQASPGLTVGLEEQEKVNGAVMQVSDTDLAKELGERASRKGLKFAWGAIGPGLITEFRSEAPQQVRALPSEAFYPIHYLETARFFRPADKAGCQAATQGAVCVHLWNEFIRRWRIPKNMMPCDGSFLSELFLRQGPCAPVGTPPPGLPLDTFEALKFAGDVGKFGHAALRGIHWTKRLKEEWLGR